MAKKQEEEKQKRVYGFAIDDKMEKQIKELGSLGCTIPEVAQFFEISDDTLERAWKKRKGEEASIGAFLKRALVSVGSLSVRRSFMLQAAGIIKYEERFEDELDEKGKKTGKKRSLGKYAAGWVERPNTAATIFWLKNHCGYTDNPSMVTDTAEAFALTLTMDNDAVEV